eukprot:1146296-Rhodomonas_salina.2
MARTHSGGGASRARSREGCVSGGGAGQGKKGGRDRCLRRGFGSLRGTAGSGCGCSQLACARRIVRYKDQERG